MASESDPAPPAPFELNTEALTTARFQFVRTLGSGGMATVDEVVDQALGKRVAVKRLHVQAKTAQRRRMLELFEHEFYLLSQIAHPHVVEVYDYGVDDRGAYYTMELLEGGDLQRLAPLPAMQVCRIGREVCSALSLLHSRRLVYRDLNPRNVHCTNELSVKLIDFGAIMSMGLPRQVVGTPAYCAPEAIGMQPLDGRADLYSLGATLYFALTGRHAYPARTFAQLRTLLESRPTRPSAIVSGVPAALDSLILTLLQINPTHRPANTLEVMEQLAAIEGHPIEESLQVSQAYLSTPTLVGHELHLELIRAKLPKMMSGQGCALSITGTAGVGRSRLLAACILEAKILGALVLRADGGRAGEEYGVARSFASALLEAAPELAQRTAAAHLAVLGHVLPDLLKTHEYVELRRFDGATAARAATLAGLRDWFLAVADERPLLFAVDDLHDVDEPSAALVALFAHDAPNHALAVIATSETQTTDRTASALKVFESVAVSIALTNLSLHHAEELFRSVFGESPQVKTAAHRVHAISNGNPRDTLRLAQYLVDKGIARYRSGAWSLPKHVADADLPSSMAQALRSQVERLSALAREVGQLISLAYDRKIRIADCLAIYAQLPPKSVHDVLEELVQAEILDRSSDGFAISQRGLHAALQDDLSDDDAERLHSKLAELFARRGYEEFRRSVHLLSARETALGLDVLIAWAKTSQAVTDVNSLEYLQLVASLPDNWLDTFSTASALCEQLQRPQSDVLALRSRLAGLVDVMRVPSAVGHPELVALLRLLARDCGLDDYAELDPGLEPGERLRRALQIAKARYEASEGKSLEPMFAMQQMVRTLFPAAGLAVLELDFDFWSALPSIAAFAPLSPALGVISRFVEGVGARLRGQYEPAMAIYLEVLERLDHPDRSGMDETPHKFLRYGLMCGVGWLECGLGRASCLAWADQLEAEPLHRVNAWRIRMLHSLWRGRGADADALRAKAELLRIESCPRTLQDGGHLLSQTIAHALSDDLTRLKHLLDEIRELPSWRPAWACVIEYAEGEYQRIRGDDKSAARHFRRALEPIRADTHQIWAYAAGAYVRVLLSSGEIEHAVRFGTESLTAAENASLGYATNFIRMPLAMALGRAGAHARARNLADQVVEHTHAVRAEGLTLILAYETRARVALSAGDTHAFEAYAVRCADHCKQLEADTLSAKCERLVHHISLLPNRISQAIENQTLDRLSHEELQSQLTECMPSERATRILQILLLRSGSQTGFLFVVGDQGPEIAASVGRTAASASLRASVSEFLYNETLGADLITRSLESETATNGLADIGTEAAEVHYPLVLLCHGTSEGAAITGVAALAVTPATTFTTPTAITAELSRMLSKTGDVKPIIVSYGGG